MSVIATSTDHFFFEAKPRWTGQIGSGGVADETVQTIPLSSVTNLTNGNAYIVTINRVDANGVKQTTWETTYGVLSGSNLTGCIRGAEGTAQAWDAGTVVEILMTATSWNKMLEGLGEFFSADGSMASGITIDDPELTGDITGDAFLDEDDMASNSATKVASQQSIKAYTDNAVNKKAIIIQVFDGASDVETGDGKAYFTIPSYLNGFILKAVHAKVVTAGTTNTTDIQIANVTDSVDMLSTKLTIDSTETGSDTAATAAVIDATKDDVATNDLLRIDVDATSTTKAKGLVVRLEFEDN